MKKLLLLAVVPAIAGSVYALPAYEPFADATANGGTAYAVDSLLYEQKQDATGIGWYQAGPGTGTQVVVSSGNLSIPGLLPSSGNSVSFGGNGTSARYAFGDNINSGTIYYSLALQITDITGLSATGVFWAGFNNTGMTSQTTPPTAVANRIITRAVEGGYQIGLDRNSGSPGAFGAWEETIFNTDAVLFIVGSYTFNPGQDNDVAKMWINPDSSTFGAVEEPFTDLVRGPSQTQIDNAATDSDINQIASFVLFNRVASQPAGIIADELRIGFSWAEVTPVPEPSTYALLALAAFGFAGFKLRKRA